jgi:cation transporter-like permease
MTTPSQLSHLRALLRSLKYMFAFASLIAIAGIIFLATVHSRVTTDVLIGMILCLCLLLTGAFFGWFALWRDPRLRFLNPDHVLVHPRRTRTRPATPGVVPADIGKCCSLSSLRLN